MSEVEKCQHCSGAGRVIRDGPWRREAVPCPVCRWSKREPTMGHPTREEAILMGEIEARDEKIEELQARIAELTKERDHAFSVSTSRRAALDQKHRKVTRFKARAKSQLRRPGCEWKGRETCFCHPGAKDE